TRRGARPPGGCDWSRTADSAALPPTVTSMESLASTPDRSLSLAVRLMTVGSTSTIATNLPPPTRPAWSLTDTPQPDAAGTPTSPRTRTVGPVMTLPLAGDVILIVGPTSETRGKSTEISCPAVTVTPERVWA